MVPSCYVGWQCLHKRGIVEPTVGNATLMSAPPPGGLAFLTKDNELGEGVSQLWTRALAWRGRRCCLRGSHRAAAGLGASEDSVTGACSRRLKSVTATGAESAKFRRRCSKLARHSRATNQGYGRVCTSRPNAQSIRKSIGAVWHR